MWRHKIFTGYDRIDKLIKFLEDYQILPENCKIVQSEEHRAFRVFYYIKTKYKIGDIVYSHTLQKNVRIKDILIEDLHNYIVEDIDGSGYFKTTEEHLSDKRN